MFILISAVCHNSSFFHTRDRQDLFFQREFAGDTPPSTRGPQQQHGWTAGPGEPE